MPYQSEHAVRLLEPETEHIRVRRTKGSGEGNVQGVNVPETIDVIWYITQSGGQEYPRAQALRFPIENWTEARVQEWLDKNKITYEKFEPAKRNDGNATDLESDVLRFDRSVMPKARKTNEGYIRADAVVTRIGIFEYQNADGTVRRELRPPEEVFATDSLETMKLIPVTNGHPTTRFVDASNSKELSIGTTGETVVQDGNNVQASLVINRKDGVEAVVAGRRELSLGYRADLFLTPGEWHGQRYDGIQRNIRYNHLAIVDSARAGKVATLHLDEANVNLTNNHKKGGKMPFIVLDGIQYEAAQEVINAHDRAIKDSIESQSAFSAEKSEHDKTRAKLDESSNKIKDLETKIAEKTDGKIIQSAIKARITLERKAARVLDEKEMEKVADMSDMDVVKAVISKKRPEVKFDGKSDDYIIARFDSIIETVEADDKNHNPDAIKNQRQTMDSPGAGGETRVDANEARKRYIQRLHNRGEEPKKQ